MPLPHWVGGSLSGERATSFGKPSLIKKVLPTVERGKLILEACSCEGSNP